MTNKTKKRFFCVTQNYQTGGAYLYEKSTTTFKAMQVYIEKLRKENEEDQEKIKPLEWTLMTIQHCQWSAEDADAHYQIYERKV